MLISINDTTTNDTTPTAADETAQAPATAAEALKEAEEMVKVMRRLLVRYENTLEHEGLRSQIETLERWMQDYRRGLEAAKEISDHATEWVNSARDQFKLAADELHRLESEGGNPLTREQVKESEDLMKAARKLEAMMPQIEKLFHCSENSEAAESERAPC